MAKIIVVVGSPRKDGNTERLADAFIQGAAAAGNEVVKFLLKDTKVNPCIACDYCMSHQGVCSQNDGMQEIYPELYTADTLVLASPVYAYGFTAQMKAMMDRLYATLAKPFKIRSCALLTVYGDTDAAVVRPLIDNYKVFVKFSKLEDLGIISVGGVLAKGDIEGSAKLMEAEALGRNIGL